MNQGDLITILARNHGFTKALAGRVLSTVFETIRSELSAGGEVRIRDFGTFRARESHGKARAKLDDSPNFFRARPSSSRPAARARPRRRRTVSRATRA